jgi:hypothetical protein
MITPKCNRQFSFRNMIADNLRNRFSNTRNESWVLENPDRGIVLSNNFLEHVMTVELDIPANPSQLLYESCIYYMNRAFVHPKLALSYVSLVIATYRTRTYLTTTLGMTGFASMLSISCRRIAHLNGQPTI